MNLYETLTQKIKAKGKGDRMLRENAFAKILPQDIEERLCRLAVANVCDGLTELGVPRAGAMDAAVKPLKPDMKFAGVAYTVKVTDGNSFPVQYGLQYGKPGYVMVVDTGSYTQGPFMGDLMANIAQRTGLNAVVIDGFVRDAAEIAATNFPVFCKGVMPRKPRKINEGELNGTVYCAGIIVKPGDVVVGDSDGVAVIPRELLEPVLVAAEQKYAADEKRKVKIAEFFTGNEHNKLDKDIKPLLGKDVVALVDK